jgi:hypothetical protein
VKAGQHPQSKQNQICLFLRTKLPIRELKEMRFQWDHPYLVDVTKFSCRFWSDPTAFVRARSALVGSAHARPAIEEGLRATIAFYGTAQR